MFRADSIDAIVYAWAKRSSTPSKPAAAARWFQPIALGPRTARTRTWVPAMVPWRASDDGQVTPAVIDWYARFAAGRPGVIVIEATGIRDVPSGPLLRIDLFTDASPDELAAVAAWVSWRGGQVLWRGRAALRARLPHEARDEAARLSVVRWIE